MCAYLVVPGKGVCPTSLVGAVFERGTEKKVYHLVGNPQKCPFRERVPKQRLPKMPFEKKFNRVARSGAGRDPIAFPA